MRSISVLGDSISTFEGCNPDGFAVFYQGERRAQTGVLDPADTWWARLVERREARLLANGSYSGSMVEGAGFPAGCSQKRVDALASDGRAPDEIVVFLGINDYGWGGAAAQAAGRSAAAPAEALADVEPAEEGLAPQGALASFAAAYDLMLERLRRAYPEAVVWCCTLVPGRVAGAAAPTFAYRLRGIPFDAYNDAIRTAAAARGCRTADARAFGFDYEAVDGTHPTARGMRQLAALVASAMEGGDLRGFDDLFDEGMRSRQTCAKPSCIGCPFARGTGNAWFAVCEKDPE